jgi:hypothetical protein
MNASKAAGHRPSAGTAVISIRGVRDPEIPLSTRFLVVLRLVFDDISAFADHSTDDTGISEEQAHSVAHSSTRTPTPTHCCCTAPPAYHAPDVWRQRSAKPAASRISGPSSITTCTAGCVPPCGSDSTSTVLADRRSGRG